MKKMIRQIFWIVTATMAMLGTVFADSNTSIVAWGTQWGWSSVIQVPGDYDGDGAFDLAVYDPAGGYWYIESLRGTSLPISSEIQGRASGSSSLPLIKFGGKLSHDPVVSGSVIIYLRDSAYGYGFGAVLGTFTDNGTGQLSGAVLDGNVPLVGSGVINYATGAWYVNLAGSGLTGSFYCQARYAAGSASSKIIAWKNQWGWKGAKPVSGDYDGDGQYDLAVVDPSSGKWYIKSLGNSIASYTTVSAEYQGSASGSSTSRLIRISGILQNTPVFSGSVTVFMRNVSGLSLVGAVNDTGSGQLQGGALLDGVVPISGSGEINYITGAWYVNLASPGLTGSINLSASYRGH